MCMCVSPFCSFQAYESRFVERRQIKFQHCCWPSIASKMQIIEIGVANFYNRREISNAALSARRHCPGTN
jgi:hypothetical protein